MLKLFTHVHVSPDHVDFGGQTVHRPDGIGAMQWIDFWEMAREVRKATPDLKELEYEIEGLRREIADLYNEIDDLQEDRDYWKAIADAIIEKNK